MTRTHKDVSKVIALIVCITMMFTFAGGNWALAEYDGIAVGNATETTANGSYTVTVNMKNNSAAPADATLIAAVYQGGTLFSVKSDSKNIAAGDNAVFSAAAELPSTGSYTCRYFTWDSFNKLKPVVNGLPKEVANALVNSTGDTYAMVSWDEGADDYAVSSYNVYRDGIFIANTTQTSYLDFGTESGAEYKYTVKAVDNAGAESENAQVIYARTADRHKLVFNTDKAAQAPYWTNGQINVNATEKKSTDGVIKTTLKGVDCIQLGTGGEKVYFTIPDEVNNADGKNIKVILTYYTTGTITPTFDYFNLNNTSSQISLEFTPVKGRWTTQEFVLTNSANGIGFYSNGWKTDRDIRLNNNTSSKLYVADIAFVKEGNMIASFDANSVIGGENNLYQKTSIAKSSNIAGTGKDGYILVDTTGSDPKLDLKLESVYASQTQPISARIGITYYDHDTYIGDSKYTNRIQVQYGGNGANVSNNLPFIYLTGANEWKTVYFDVDDFYCGVNTAFDIRVNSVANSDNENVYISKITVAQKPNSQTTNSPDIFIAGDSTAQTYSSSYNGGVNAGWGQKLSDYLTGITVDNRAYGGASSETFLQGVSIDSNSDTVTISNNVRMEKILSKGKKGDYLFIQFGHNDSETDKEKGCSIDEYKENLSTFVALAKRYGISPVFVTSVPMHNFNNGTWNDDGVENYRTEMKNVAETLKVPVIDLASLMLSHISDLGETISARYYYPVEGDNVHFSHEGATLAAKLVAKYLANYDGDDAVLAELGSYVDTDSIADAQLDAPANLKVTAEKATSISLSWDSVEGATGYKVYRNNIAVATLTETNYKDANLDSGTEYTYTVTALNGDTESEKSSAVTGTTRVVASLEFNLDTIGFANGGAGKFTGTLMSVAENNSIDPTYDAATAAITLTEIDNTPCALFNWVSDSCPNMTFILDETVTASKGENDDNLWAIVTYYTEKGSGTKQGKIEYVDDSDTPKTLKYSLNKGWNTMAIELTGTASGVKYGTSDNRFRINPKDTGVSMYISKIEVTRGYEADQ